MKNKGKQPYIPSVEQLPVFSDDRGIFVPFVQNNHLENRQLIKRVYYVSNYGKGIVRGFHFHNKEWKYFTIVQGAAKFVAVNPEIPQKQFSFVSSSRKQNIITIPPGFANGWVSLEDTTILLCASTATLEESVQDDMRYDPYTWGDVWSVKGR
jgi:dTDP-4-dehydrorhamnose 3,5-epimerase